MLETRTISDVKPPLKGSMRTGLTSSKQMTQQKWSEQLQQLRNNRVRIFITFEIFQFELFIVFVIIFLLFIGFFDGRNIRVSHGSEALNPKYFYRVHPVPLGEFYGHV